MRYKIKNDSGSAMVLVIFSIMIVSIFGIYAVKQIGTQLNSSNNIYENRQGIYMAESSIEQTIYELENQIYSNLKNKSRYSIDLYNGEWINVDHSMHDSTKVKYEKEGKVNYDSFNKLIFTELLNANGSKDTFWSLHNSIISDLKIISETASIDFKMTTDILWQQGGYLKDMAHNSEEALSLFVEKVNNSINQLNDAKKIYESKLPNDKVEEAINRADRLKGVFEEILCRLGLLKGESTIPININLYSSSVDKEGSIDRKIIKVINTDLKGNDLSVKYIYKDNKLQDIKFGDLNEVLNTGIYGDGMLKRNLTTLSKSIRKNYRIQFYFNNGKIDYSSSSIENE